MPEFYKTGRYFFAISLIAFGVSQLVTGKFMIGFLPVVDSTSGRMVIFYLFTPSA